MPWASERLTGSQVCAALGIESRRLRQLVRENLIAATMVGEGYRTRYLVTGIALVHFLRTRSHEYDPRRVADEWTDFLPDDAFDDPWLTTTEVGALLHMSPRNVSYAVRAGMVSIRRRSGGMGGGTEGAAVMRRSEALRLGELFAAGQTPGRHTQPVRRCAPCGHHHPAGDFRVYQRRDGRLRWVCRVEQRDRARASYHKKVRRLSPGESRRTTEESDSGQVGCGTVLRVRESSIAV